MDVLRCRLQPPGEAGAGFTEGKGMNQRGGHGRGEALKPGVLTVPRGWAGRRSHQGLASAAPSSTQRPGEHLSGPGKGTHRAALDLVGE